MIALKTFIFNPFQENSYILSDESKECIIVDPGMNSPAEQDELINYIKNNNLLPKAIVNTHCHVDHVLGCLCLIKKYTIPFYAHELEIPLLETAIQFGEFFGLEVEQPPAPDHYLTEGQEYNFGVSSLQILHVPGHSKGSVALYSKTDKLILTGDVLFYGSVGRTDLPGGDYNTLINSIREKIMSLPKDVDVYPGHGPKTTIQYEYDTNPFLKQEV